MTDLASFVKFVDKHIDSSRIDTDDEIETVPSPSPSVALAIPDPDYLEPHFTPPPRQASLRIPMMTECKVNTQVPSPVYELEQCHAVSTRSGPTLVPQPISPAKMLRLKNSIPRLMKALPPLPECDANPDYPALRRAAVPMGTEPIEISQLTDARSTLGNTIEGKDQDDEAPMAFDPFVFDRRVRKPKLKLKHAASFSQKTQDRTDTSSSEHPGCDSPTLLAHSTAPIKRRLPLRISRSAMLSPSQEDNDTVKRRLGVPKSSTVSELTAFYPLDLFNSPMRLHPSIQDPACFSPRRPVNYIREQMSVPSLYLTSTAKLQDDHPNDDARGASLDTQLEILQSVPSMAVKASEVAPDRRPSSPTSTL
ncbi:hypothetical protein BD289DRAFT_429049 [Coniella lustricola]|uniref:Uncharacterized protein n=1 Tax=Coniella lustricola TaxID=2025994 RepID=A0A2T3AD84_9PEZI|nr:hypothetical protein BD289DRAFT_429049 [Coniella lustricola]